MSNPSNPPLPPPAPRPPCFLACFPSKVVSALETSLTGNQPMADIDARKMQWQTVDVTGGAVQAQLEENGPAFNSR